MLAHTSSTLTPHAIPAASVTRCRYGSETALHRAELTRTLAEGVDPNTRAELSLSAAQLTSARNRRTLARAMRRTLTEAHDPPMTRSRIIITDRRAVLGLNPLQSITHRDQRLPSSTYLQFIGAHRRTYAYCAKSFSPWSHGDGGGRRPAIPKPGDVPRVPLCAG